MVQILRDLSKYMKVPMKHYIIRYSIRMLVTERRYVKSSRCLKESKTDSYDLRRCGGEPGKEPGADELFGAVPHGRAFSRLICT